MEHKITPHFRLVKCICPCCDRVKVIPRFFRHMELLEKMREILSFPIHINSAYRCEKHNLEVGGSENSYHMTFATDVRPGYGVGFKEKLEAMHKIAKQIGFKGIIYHDSFLHLDTRRRKYYADERKKT